MWKIELDVDSNGLVIFDPDVVKAYWGGSLALGTNLFRRFRTEELGDEVLRDGLFVPVLAIDDLGYDVIVRLVEEPTDVPSEWIITINEFYALRVVTDIVIADLDSIMEWDAGEYGHRLGVPPGNYQVSVTAFAAPELASCGYQFALKLVAELPAVSADPGAPMRVLRP